MSRMIFEYDVESETTNEVKCVDLISNHEWLARIYYTTKNHDRVLFMEDYGEKYFLNVDVVKEKFNLYNVEGKPSYIEVWNTRFSKEGTLLEKSTNVVKLTRRYVDKQLVETMTELHGTIITR